LKVLLSILFISLATASSAYAQKLLLQGKAISCLAINQVEPNILYAGVQDEGIYVSRDSGVNWQAVWDSGSVSCIAVDQSNPRFVYAGVPGGVIGDKSGGHTFGTLWPGNGLAINCLTVDQSQAKAVLIGTDHGVYKSLGGGKNFQKAGLEVQNITALAISNQGQKPTIFAATDKAGIFQSDNFGVSWSPANVGLQQAVVQSMICDLSNPANLVAATQENGIFWSNDQGKHWQAATPDSLQSQGYFLAQCRRLHSLQVTMYAVSYAGQVLRSGNAGKTWQTIPAKLRDASVLCFGVASTEPVRLYVGTSKGLFVVEDRP
jgi:photosystem II stability/assembly factor-like uncharacterized protein